MKEIDTSQDETTGHLKLGSEEILQNLYRITTHFFGSERLTALANEDTGPHFYQLRDRFEEAEIQRLLLTVAVRIRILDDAYKHQSGDNTGRWAVHVGRFYRDSTDSGSNVPLSLREACNKIIHASWLNFVREGEDPDGQHLFPLVPQVAIYGTRPRSAVIWKTDLEIEGFVNAATAITELVE